MGSSVKPRESGYESSFVLSSVGDAKLVVIRPVQATVTAGERVSPWICSKGDGVRTMVRG
jgi:hypothetical protein